MDRGAWQTAVLRITQSDITEASKRQCANTSHSQNLSSRGKERVSFEKSNKNPTFHSLWLDKTQLNSHT